MSNNTTGPEFWHRANALINIANAQCDAAHPNEVGASTMFASARFNAFIVAKTTGSAQNMALEKEHVMAYLTDQYRKMLEDNLDDFARNYERYMAGDQQR
ncbi:DUF3144 domain-containing protein [uncultured Massilia sp.]|uniref:DUF3144 domain-containing protein n=1 Tax=uncultured Massilia sp. TaxID=169973 RepID=UPI0025D1D4E0|nr:DUF3144 domain-containing protein [uncultured Massilia sp.]